MEARRHLFPTQSATVQPYTYPRTVVTGEFRVPPRDSPLSHGTKLVKELQAAEQAAESESQDLTKDKKPKGVVLDFTSDPGFKLVLKSLELRRSGIELRNSRTVDTTMHATVFVPDGKVGIFVRKIEAYTTQKTDKGLPRNKDLAESISGVRLAALESFWTDSGELPTDPATPHWWEVWLREATNPHDVGDVFRDRAASAGITVGGRELRFPERRVLLARATIGQWMAFENLFDILAELRLAKILAGEFLELPPRDQAEFIDDAVSRIQAPPHDAPAVCHLDTGVNRGHPLLQLAIQPEHVLSVEPDWQPADLHGHGTEMAGLALYGCLTELFAHSSEIVLTHRLESVKILPDHGSNDPDLYGHISSQAISRAEIASPHSDQRAFCLTVTTDGRDEGYPSSWSAALDQTCSGAVEEETPRRLMFVSAGNTPGDNRHNYPAHNHVHGIEDPAQSWNALTVGACTFRDSIQSPEYAGWHPIAQSGSLSPSSRTSIVWEDRAWPLKPDIVMEGGNSVVDPSTGRADYVDDTLLLTTRMSPDGSLLTTTGDTSGAAALAARYAAIIWSSYPALWPETVRAALVHSAVWTNRMLEEFPDGQGGARQNRLRCYGYGVPNLHKALWSVDNAATMVIEDSLSPFRLDDGDIKTNQLHLHRLPWPVQVLEELDSTPVTMKVTLSYFIEPSPGRRGWTRRHRYQSHGLRFEVKRPLETDQEFQRRISREAQDEDDPQTHGSDSRNWQLGLQLRSKGSIHRDVWTGTGAELAQCGTLAVFPVTGWWKERKHLECWDRQARYALLVSIETPSSDVDLYTPIEAQIGVPVSVEIEDLD